MTEPLSDSNTYDIIKKVPTRKITDSLRSFLSKWKQKGYITEQTYKGILIIDGLLSRAYRLPKIHKSSVPLKLIVSSINSPLYALAVYLHKILIKYLSESTSFVKNSF